MIAIFSFLGIPFKNKGRDFSGVDCYGLVFLFYKYDRGTELEKYSHEYGSCNNPKQADRALKQHKDEWKSVTLPKFGDVILFRKSGLFTHVGIYINEKQFLHIQKGNTSCLSELKDFEKAIEGYYEYIQN